MTRNIDELSNLKPRAVEPRKYFDEMDLNEEQIQNRLDYTEKANGAFDTILVMLMSMKENGNIDYAFLRGLLITWLLSIIAEFVTPDDYLIDYATDTAYNFMETSQKNIDKEWYTSPDRALFNAENSANDVLNYSEYEKAIEAGKTHKQWITEKDNRVRESHRDVEKKPIPIKEFFRVGLARMRFPKDYEYASEFPEEIVNCRCSIKYFGNKDEKSFELYRKEENTGAFSVNEELMSLRHVKNIVNDMNLDYNDVKYRIDRNEEMLRTGYFGHTSDDAKTITLYPDAFMNREQLVKTIGHENVHLKQTRRYGKVKTEEELYLREAEAVASEEKWWND